MTLSRARRPFLTATAVIVLAIGPVSGVLAAGLTVGPNVDISGFADNEAETTVAVNPANPNNVVVVSNFQTADALMESVSFDGGATWSARMIADGSDDLGVACCDANAAFDQYGNFFLVYLDLRAKKVQTAYSTDGGLTLQFLATLDHSDRSNPMANGKKWGAGADQPSLATGPGGTWFVYKMFSQGGQLLQVRGLPVSGLGQFGPLSASQSVPGSKYGSFGDIAVGQNGQVLVTYQDNIPTQGPSTIWTNLDPDGFGPAGFGDARAATATNVGGFDYIPPQARRSVDAEAGLAYDRSGGTHHGRVYLLYTDEQPNESDNTDIWVRRSDDDGATWSAPVRVNDDAGTNSQFNPHIAIDQATGFIAVGFHDARNDLGSGPGDTNGIPNDEAQYFLAVSRNGGASFSANVQVSAGTSNAEAAHNGVQYGDYTGLGFAGGLIHPAWADNSDSTGGNPDGALDRFDVYSAAIIVR
ncbi:MAG: hypothetical protein DMF82_18405 [Acidobacteria bacterium]|nr:MAG: hypothetical protein DMF82_18405 [Acidobacteriota bacterium]